MPVRGIEVLNGFPDKPGAFDLLFDRAEFVNAPQLVRVSREAPTSQFPNWLILAWIRGSAFIEVIDQMHHGVRRAHLPRKAVVSGREHVPVESKSKLHLL